MKKTIAIFSSVLMMITASAVAQNHPDTAYLSGIIKELASQPEYQFGVPWAQRSRRLC